MVSTQVVWISVAIIAIIVGAGLITWFAILVERQTSRTISGFSCDSPSSGPFPDCGTLIVRSGVPGSLASGFFSARTISPTISPSKTISVTPLTGYYHSHPTAYYKSNPSGLLYSYPFVSQITSSGVTNGPPIFRLTSFSYSTTLSETAAIPFEQFSYPSTSLDSANFGYTMFLNCADSGMMPLQPDKLAYQAQGGSPTLTSILSSSEQSFPDSRSVKLILTQGVPFVTLSYTSSSIGSQLRPVLSIPKTSYSSHLTPYPIVVGQTTYNVYTFWRSAGPTPRCILWFVNANVWQDMIVDSDDTAILRLGTENGGPINGLVYISMFTQVGPLLSMVVQLIAESLMPYSIQLADIIPSDTNTAMQYSIVPIPGVDWTSPNPRTTTLWIVPPTSFGTAGLAAITLPGTGYFDFPVGNGMFQTQPSGGTGSLISFFTLWPPSHPSITDFTSFVLPNAGSGVSDTNSLTTSDADLYALSTAIRVLYVTIGSSGPTPSMVNNCVQSFSAKLNGMGIGIGDFSLFTTSLGDTDAGLVSRVSYLLLTYINLFAVRGFIGSLTSAGLLLSAAVPQITMLIESGLTTQLLNNQSSYTPLAFLDTYSCTMPMIKTINNQVVPITPAQLSSRLGEVLSYLWACDLLSVSDQNLALLSRCLYSITLEATTRLLRGQCISYPMTTPSLAPVIPLTTIVSQSSMGFQLDGATPGGNSPDATFLQVFSPFSPATHISLRPMFSSFTIAVDKLLRCNQFIPQFPGASYSFNSYVDPALVGYYTYLYTLGDRSNMLITGRVDSDLTAFVKMVSPPHPSVALLMNLVKVGMNSQAIVVRT